MTSVRTLEIRVNQTGNAKNAIGMLSKGLGGLATVAAVGVAVGLAAATAAIVTLGAKSATVAADFEEQMNILEVAARQSETSLEDLSEAAIQVGADTDIVGVSASQAAEAMTNFYKAGFTTGEIFSDLDGYLAGNVELTGALRAAVDLAAASELSLAESSDIVAIAMATFGMNTAEAGAIADSFVASADASVASVPELADALANVGPTAAAFGWSLDTLNVALALLSERGIRGSEAGTALKSMMTNIMRPTDKVSQSLRDLNVELYTSDGVMKDLPVIMAELEAGMVGMTDEQKNLHIQILAGTFGMKAMQTLLAEGTTGWNEMTTAVSEGATAQETADARTRGYNAAIEQMQGSIESLMIRAGTPLIENFLTPAIKLFTEWLPTLEKVGGEVIPIMEDSLQRIIQALGGTNEEIDWADTFLQGLTITLGAAITAVEFMADTTESLATWIETASVTVRAFNEDTIKPFIQTVKDWVAEFKEQAIPVMERLNVLVDEVLKPALDSFKESWEKIQEVFGGASEKGEETGKVISDIDIILGAFEATVSLAIFTIAAIAGTVESVATALYNMKRALSDVAEGWEEMKRKAREAIDAIPPWLIPGSPTPFEMGLRGIGSALGNVNLAGGSGGGSPGLGGAGAAAIVTVNFHYSPAISLADRFEAEEKLAPMIASAIRQQTGVA